MEGAPSFEEAFDARDLERLLPDGQGVDAQRPVMRAWYEHLRDDDVAWCLGDAAGAYGLLAAERLGPDRVVVFESDASRIPTVEDVLAGNGYGAVPVEPVTFLGWQRPGRGMDTGTRTGMADPVSEVVEFTDTPGEPTRLLLDVPGYGSDVLSTLGFGDELSLRGVLLKSTDTLATSELEADGFETTLLATRPGHSDPWRRAVLARSDPTTELSLPESVEEPSDARGEGAPSTALATGVDEGADREYSVSGGERTRHAGRVRDAVSLVVTGILYALSGLFYGLSVLLRVLAYIPGMKYVVGNTVVGLVVAALFALFLVLGTITVELGELVGVSEQTAAAGAGIVVLAIPISIGVAFLYLAVAVRRDH